MFGVARQRFDKHVVVPDLHGECGYLKLAIDRYYDDEDVGFVLLGDLIDRKGMSKDTDQESVRLTIETVRQLGNRAVLTIANHEWYLLGSVLCRNTVHRQAIQELWMSKRFGNNKSTEKNTFSSYGLANDGATSASDLWDAMQRHEHAEVLTGATPYYETDKFIAVHAGLQYDTTWEEQRVDLDLVAAQMSNGVFEEQPEQWFGSVIATEATENNATNKTVVSGHAHYLVPNKKYVRGVSISSGQRVLHDGRRVRLASQINPPVSDSLFVWQDWDGEVIKIEK